MHCAFAMLLTMAGASQAVQTVESLPDVPAVRLTQPVVVDGVLDEEVWEKAPPVTAFVQREPNEGAAATEKTEVRIAYDDEALYIGARMLDSKPAGIVARLGRRDASLTADELTFYVDPYHDGRGGYYFAVNAAGTMRDGVLYNDDWNDDSWDGIWEGRARVDATGWTVELRIPYSQLRFRREESYRWGVNFRRYICSKKEEDYLVFTPKKASGFVSRFPHLSGLVGITPPRRIALTPYTIGKAEFTGHDAGDPFNDGSRLRPALGADFKVGLGSTPTSGRWRWTPRWSTSATWRPSSPRSARSSSRAPTTSASARAAPPTGGASTGATRSSSTAGASGARRRARCPTTTSPTRRRGRASSPPAS